MRESAIFRHSLLNFGHIKYLENSDFLDSMSAAEREWLERAATAPAVETVLKAGEILYIPSCKSNSMSNTLSHRSYLTLIDRISASKVWFHYIVSVQKSAQCNVRSGVEDEPHVEFGGKEDVQECTTA
jgi:hypothetical protein